MGIVTQAVRNQLDADGATFVLRDGAMCHYADEHAIAPLWKGRRFPMHSCISGWCMTHDQAVAIADIYEDERIPHDAYRPTFVRSLALAPVRRQEPFAAIGAYWSRTRQTSADELDLLQTIADASGLAISVAQLAPVADARLAAEAAEARYRAVFDQAAAGVARIAFDGRFLEVNQRFRRLTGYDSAELARLTATEITHPDDLAEESAATAALMAGEVQIRSLERRFIRKDGQSVWVNLTESLVRRPDGAPDYLVAIVEDISERKASEAAARAHEEHLKLLINELNHRVKNTLTTVQSMAVQTLRGAVDPEEAISRLESRIVGLSAAHNILTARNWEGAALGELIERTILPFAMDAPERIARVGRELWIKPQMAVALSIAFHELATNAVKYGALSTPQGRVDIGWACEDGLLEIRWTESGGPPVSAPRRKGFGSRVIERSLPRELGAPATLQFAPEGLTCAIRAVLVDAKRSDGL